MKNLANFPSADLTHHRSALDHFQLAAFVFVPSPPTKNSFFSFYCEREFSNRPKKDSHNIVITILEHHMLFFANVMH